MKRIFGRSTASVSRPNIIGMAANPKPQENQSNCPQRQKQAIQQTTILGRDQQIMVLLTRKR
jgi:hypothetical protein